MSWFEFVLTFQYLLIQIQLRKEKANFFSINEAGQQQQQVGFYLPMKKNPQKTKNNCKTKIQVKIKGKNVTNNFILAPRSSSLRDGRQTPLYIEGPHQETNIERIRNEDGSSCKGNKNLNKHQYRLVSTDHQKIPPTARRKFQQDETGTHTPFAKRMSLASEGIKKKSHQSLMGSQRGKTKQKSSASESGQLSKIMLQRVIGVIIKDFRQGKLKQHELEQTLLELYDRRQKKKNTKRSKKRQKGLATFSNQFLRSNQQSKTKINSQALLRKRKDSDEAEMYEGVLSRQNFVNKIIIKGITTSLFLREQMELSTVKESEMRMKMREPSYQINTSNSVREINQEMKTIQERYNAQFRSKSYTFEDKMAIRIQRAWRTYRTQILLRKISQDKEHPITMLDQFTDEDNDEVHSPRQQNKTGSIKQKQYEQLVKLVSNSLQKKDISKQECLKTILQFLNVPQDIIKVDEDEQQESYEIQLKQQKDGEGRIESHLIEQYPDEQAEFVDNEQNQEKIQIYEHNFESDESSQNLSHSELIKMSRVKMIYATQSQNIQQIANLQQTPSNQLNSFTNKYSSREGNEQGQHQERIDTEEEVDQSLTFAHSQTSNNQIFKTVNIQTIEEGLSGREDALSARKEKELEDLTQKLFASKITKENYQQQKDKLQKWYKTRQKQLKKVKNSLLKSCNEARKIIEAQPVTLNSEKSKKMLKCLSDKYIKKESWSITSTEPQHKQVYSKVKCQQMDLPISQTKSIQNQHKQHQNKKDHPAQKVLPFEDREKQKEEWQNKDVEISPKMSRHTSLQLQQNDYKYEQIEQIIEEDDDGIQQNGLDKPQFKVQLQSDKFINGDPFEEQLIEDHQIELINELVNQKTKKYKYLCAQDKEDIFQFLFLDLILQMFTENFQGQNRILKATEQYISKAKRLRKIPKGIKTGLANCKQYLRVLANYVLKQQNCLNNLSLPMGPSAAEMLKYMRDQISQVEDDDSVTSTIILSTELFQKVSKSPDLQLKIQRYYDDEEREMSRLGFLKTAQHINNKALFDSLNQMLDHQRPYGVWGKPFPWKKSLAMDRDWNSQVQIKKLKNASDRTIQSCSYLCGILADKEDSLFGGHRVSQQYIIQIREDRLSKMLANELIQNQQRWIFYDDEQTEIMMQVSSFVTKKLIKEVVLELFSIQMRS